MRRDIPELLAPAGDRGAFLVAVAAGADAIYCGVTGQLNARRRAGGIAPDELAGLCGLAHSRGVRVYATMNVAVKQAELAGAVEAARSVLDAGADALIIQDLGFLAEVRRQLPQAEIHVSTQANVHDARGVRLCERLGASRVTLSRELPLAEIAAISAETSAELEVFSHGAICPSYSGVCMLSSFLRQGRSPNRGLCAQPCRLPFDLVDEAGVRLQPAERERALCTHDNCVIEHIDELARAGVSALKLEGRMKPAAYVWAVTSAYRAALDAWAAGTRMDETAVLGEAPALSADGCCEGVSGRRADVTNPGLSRPVVCVDAACGEAPAVSADERYEGVSGCCADAANPGSGNPVTCDSATHGEADASLFVTSDGSLDSRRVLKRSFNRGLTDAYLRGTSGNELMSYERSGNRGELVGAVVGFEPEPGFVPRDGQQLRGTVFVQLDEPVGAGDSIELRPLDDPERFLVVKAGCNVAAGETIACPCPRPMPAGAEARVTKSAELERLAAEAVSSLEQEL